MSRHTDESARNARRDEEHLAEIATRENHDMRTCRCEGCNLLRWFDGEPKEQK